MLGKVLNGVQKSSNWALNIGKNTRAPVEGIFRGVRPKNGRNGRRHNTNSAEDWCNGR